MRTKGTDSLGLTQYHFWFWEEVHALSLWVRWISRLKNFLRSSSLLCWLYGFSYFSWWWWLIVTLRVRRFNMFIRFCCFLCWLFDFWLFSWYQWLIITLRVRQFRYYWCFTWTALRLSCLIGWSSPSSSWCCCRSSLCCCLKSSLYYFFVWWIS